MIILTIEAAEAQEITSKKSTMKAIQQNNVEVKVVKKKQQLKKIEITITQLRKLLSQPIPKNLTKKEKKEWQRHSAWLKKSIQRINKFQQQHKGPKVYSKSNKSTKITDKNMQQSQMNFNAQLLALQNALQQESRRYQTLSNASKTRHQTAMNSIRNMK